MKYLIAAIGQLKSGAAKDLYDEYKSRLKTSIEVREEKSDQGDLLKYIPKGAKLIALDEAGTLLSSIEFADLIGSYQNQGVGQIVFAIGGSQGHTPQIRERADFLLSFGKMTWPHLLVRGLLMEQLYRAQQILAYHPYHKE